MLKNCFTTFKQFKTAAFLNITGLSVAFAVFIVIATQLRHEFTYDTSYKNGKNIYRMEIYDALSQSYSTACGLPMIESFAEHIPGIENFGALYIDGGKALISRIDEEGIKRTYSERRCNITPGFIDVFSMEIVAGDAKAALEAPFQCIIPQSMVQRMFGHENPIGKTIVRDEKEFTVLAIYRDFPKNSSVPNAIFSKLEDKRWDMWSYIGFFQLTPGVDVDEVVRKINESDAANLGVSLDHEDAVETLKWVAEHLTFSLKPVKDIYFSKTITWGYGQSKVGNKTLSYVLMLIGILIMVIAYVNFTNFSTALAPVRIKSINTRRVMGATQGALSGSIMTEAAVISFFSFLLSLLWVYIFAQSTLSTAFFYNPTLGANIDILIITGVLSIILGLLSGAYPATYMTSFQPALVLKGSFALTPQGIRLRNTLITIQFFTAMALITGTLFIKLQHDYMRKRPIGMERENIVMLSVFQDKNVLSQLNALTNEMMQNPRITDYTTALSKPGFIGMGIGRDFDGTQIQVACWSVGHNFLRFFNIPIIEGNDFFEHNETGESKFIFNQKTITHYGLENPIGKTMDGFPVNKGTVVGIAADANFASLHREIQPMVFLCGDDQPINYLFFKIDAANIPATVTYIKSVYAKFSPDEPEISFVDEDLNKLYQNEANLANIISLFSLIAIIISLMGIYGLILFNAKFKVREIGIRKVNGASEIEIILLLNKGFLHLIAIAFIIATPISYYLIFNWLKEFPYRVAIYWWVFAIAGIMTLLITLLTVSYQSWKAAAANPTKSLKV